ncbi:YncE family protein [Rhodococcus marinonascens]|uniref:YncE family protein n=1 Tax=Rhodococcus marinonascens TaxID=38311 RepID=UPI000A8EEAF6|nr:YncE family protein [Rhodococcus marinonascens]
MWTAATPVGVAVTTPDGSHAYVTNGSDDSVSVIETAGNTVVDTVPVGDAPVGVAITPDGSHAYVANGADDSVSVIGRHRPGRGRPVRGGDHPERETRLRHQHIRRFGVGDRHRPVPRLAVPRLRVADRQRLGCRQRVQLTTAPFSRMTPPPRP